MSQLKVRQFTVSCSKNISHGRDTDSAFVSMGFEMPESVSPEQAMLLEMEAYGYVHRSVVLSSVAAGSINPDDAKIILDDFDTRQEGIIFSLKRKYNMPGNNSDET